MQILDCEEFTTFWPNFWWWLKVSLVFALSLDPSKAFFCGKELTYFLLVESGQECRDIYQPCTYKHTYVYTFIGIGYVLQLLFLLFRASVSV